MTQYDVSANHSLMKISLLDYLDEINPDVEHVDKLSCWDESLKKRMIAAALRADSFDGTFQV